MRRILIILTMTAGLISPVAGQNVQEAPKEEKKICRSEPPPIGSIMGARRSCRSKADWIKIDEVNRRNTERALDARRINNRPGE